ncbi:MAG: 2-oxopent-4-enoate hydratase [Myxococcales bacterium]|nr:2-oxopent-4-enoate hydratase [Myxococcales bacterium]|tara:strand:+ start:2940 stop:3782 length:843 start_codon:yes stop_codon:yes gene_type:complete
MVSHQALFDLAFCQIFEGDVLPVDHSLIKALGDEIFEALRTRQTLPPITERYADFTIDDAYQVSLRILAHRKARGETLIGKKIGVTSFAVQNMLGVDQPDFGFLLDQMVYEDEMPISETLIQPRAEGELAFVLKKSLVGPGVTDADVIAATEWVMPCFEVVDSRIEDWRIKIEDTVADNASCGLFSMGPKVKPEGLDFPNLEMTVWKNGEVVAEGKGSAALGSPVKCVTWLANTLGQYGITLDAGDVILSGSWVPLLPVVPGDVMKLEIKGLGLTELRLT